jgi:hypothetical protein
MNNDDYGCCESKGSISTLGAKRADCKRGVRDFTLLFRKHLDKLSILINAPVRLTYANANFQK